MKPRMQLKSPSGWFAAGREVEQALLLLSDSAFRVFMWICLRAERSTGSLRLDAAQWGRLLRKSSAQLHRDLDELDRLQLCRLAGDRLVIRDRFWPYQRLDSGVSGNGDVPLPYVAAVKQAFLRPACVVSAFSAADEQLARDWERRGISLETVQRAILLGVARKYTAWLSHGTGTPITGLKYFAGIIPEVEHATPGPDYWTYVARKVHMLEVQLQRQQTQTCTPVMPETK